MTAKHPAKFHDEAIKRAAPYLIDCEAILDPFAGVGRVFELLDYGVEADIWGVEIEDGWEGMEQYANGGQLLIGDSTKLLDFFYEDTFDGVFVSPTYGNRMADKHDAKDGSKRITYKHRLERDLHPNNTGGMQWGAGYKALHTQVWSQLTRVAIDGCIGVFNIKNHIRAGKEMPVVEWHIATLASFGWRLREAVKLDTPGLRRGQNHELRVDADLLVVMELGKDERKGVDDKGSTPS